jgi:hypothetical protein
MNDIVAFGRALHSLQDSWSHQGFIYQHGLSHKPDQAWIESRWEGRDLDMAKAVYSKMEAFLDWNPNRRAGLTQPFPEHFVKEYLQLTSSRAKEHLLRKEGFDEYYQLLGYSKIRDRGGNHYQIPVYQYAFE